MTDLRGNCLGNGIENDVQNSTVHDNAVQNRVTQENDIAKAADYTKFTEQIVQKRRHWQMLYRQCCTEHVVLTNEKMLPIIC